MDEKKRKYMERREAAFIGDTSYHDNPNCSQSAEMYRPDYIDRDFLHHNIPPLWSHHNAPTPSHYYWGTQKYECDEREEGSISTSSRSGSRRCKTVAVLVSLGLLVVVGGAITLAVYFTNLSNVNRTEVSTPAPSDSPAQLIFLGDVSIDKNWYPDLSNQSSPTYQKKAERVSKMIDKVYKSGDLVDLYIDNTVNSFRQGSTYVEFFVRFENPEVSAITVTNAPIVEQINPEKLVKSFIQTLQTVKIEEADGLDIDTASLTFQDVTLGAQDKRTTKAQATTTMTVTQPTSSISTTEQSTTTITSTRLTTRESTTIVPHTNTLTTQSTTTSTTSQPTRTQLTTTTPITGEQTSKNTQSESTRSTTPPTTTTIFTTQSASTSMTQPSNSTLTTQPFFTTTILSTSPTSSTTQSLVTNSTITQTTNSLQTIEPTTETSTTQPTSTSNTKQLPTTTLNHLNQTIETNITQSSTSTSTTTRLNTTTKAQPTTKTSTTTESTTSILTTTQPTTTSSFTTYNPPSTILTRTLSTRTSTTETSMLNTDSMNTTTTDTTELQNGSKTTFPVYPTHIYSYNDTTANITESWNNTVMTTSSLKNSSLTTMAPNATVAQSQNATSVSYMPNTTNQRDNETTSPSKHELSSTMAPQVTESLNDTTISFLPYTTDSYNKTFMTTQSASQNGSVTTIAPDTSTIPADNRASLISTPNTTNLWNNRTAMTTASTSSTFQNGTCFESSSISYQFHCKRIGFNVTSFPNFLGQTETQFDIFLFILFENGWNCSMNLQNLSIAFCSLLAPDCNNGINIPLCREDCFEFDDNCAISNISEIQNIREICNTFPLYSSGQQCIHYADWTLPSNQESTVIPTTPAIVANYTTSASTTITTISPGNCGGYYYNLSGYFTSPNYPNNYPNDADCYYNIIVPDWYFIRLSITKFASEICCDYLKIYDGGSVNDTLLLELRGTSSASIIDSTSNKLTLYFHSDGSVVHSGFIATYASNTQACTVDKIQCSDVNLADCVTISKLCDGYPDCISGFDEQHCENYTTSYNTTPLIFTTPRPYSTPPMPSTTDEPMNIEVRLVNGTICAEGRVEISMNGVWGSISTNHFNIYAAGVICRQLGFSGTGAIPLLGGYFGQAASTVPIWYTYVSCSVYHRRIEECYTQNDGVSSHLRDVGVRCLSESEYYCSFDTECNFLRANSNTSVYWNRANGCIPFGAGPCSGNNGVGYYFYFETIHGAYENTAELISTTIYDDAPRCLSFYYHIYGDAINELQVKVKGQSNHSGTILWSIKNDQGYQWHTTSINIQADDALQIIFVGISGSSNRNNIAIDDVRLSKGSCDSVLEDLCPREPEHFGVSCTFRSKSACNYTTSPVSGTVIWTYKGDSTSAVNLPSTDATENKNGYFFYQSIYGMEGDMSSLSSPLFTTTMNSSLRFYTYFDGSEVGSLRVSARDNSGVIISLWHSSREQEKGWLQSCVLISNVTDIVVEFLVTRGSGNQSVVAVDNITVSDEACHVGIRGKACDFNQPFTCGYHVNCSCTTPTYPYKWNRHFGPTRSEFTGPEADAQNKGYYIHAEATFGNKGDTTTLTFPAFQTTGDQYLQFKYHMFGNETGTLLVQAKVDNSVSSIWSLSGNQGNHWKQVCLQLNFTAHKTIEVSFVAVRGYGSLGDIAMDDIIVTEEMCPHTASCDFSFGSCDYVTLKDGITDWVLGQQKNVPNTAQMDDYFYTNSNHFNEGQHAFLISPFFFAFGNESLNFNYINSPYTHFEVGWISSVRSDITRKTLKYDEIDILMETTSEAFEWKTRCLSLKGIKGEIALVFIQIIGVGNSQLSAVDNIKVLKQDCQVGIIHGMCTFDPTELCGYNVFAADKCVTEETYRWKVYREHGNNMMMVNGSFGERGDTSILEFPVISIDNNMYLHFTYLIQNWDNSSNLQYSTDSGNQFNAVSLSKPYLPVWHLFCSPNVSVNTLEVMFMAEKTEKDINMFIDNVTVSFEPCPVRSTTCDFNDPYICGYLKSDSWTRTKHESHLGVNNFLVSPKVVSKSNIQCVEFNYKYIGESIVHFILMLYREESESTKVSLKGTHNWTLFRFQSEKAFDFIVLDIDRFLYPSALTEIAMVDNISMTEGNCQLLDCNANENRCASGLQCIPNSSVCNAETDCYDGSDEDSCDKSIACDFESARICDYILSGNNIVRTMSADGNHYISVYASGLCLLKSPLEYIPQTSCLSFLTKATFSLDRAVRVILKDQTGIVTPSAVLKSIFRLSDFWVKHQAELPRGNYSIIFEMLFENYVNRGYIFIDDIAVQLGQCDQDCGSGYFNCTADQKCIPAARICDTRHDCSDSEDELKCDYSITCQFETEGICRYVSEDKTWKEGKNEMFSGYFLDDHTYHNSTGSYLYAGNLNSEYSNYEMRTMATETHQQMCVQFNYAVIRPIEYSSSFLTIHQNISFGFLKVFSFVEFRQDVSLQWQKGQFSVAPGYFNLRFSAGGHRSIIAIDDVMLNEGACSEYTTEGIPYKNDSFLNTTDSYLYSTNSFHLTSDSFSYTTDSPYVDGCYRHDSGICPYTFGLRLTIFPNVFGHSYYNEAWNSVSYYLRYGPIFGCTKLSYHLLCAMVFPECSNGTAKPICKQSCKDSLASLLDNCHQTYIYGSKISDFFLYCDLLRNDDACVNIPAYVSSNSASGFQSTPRPPIATIGNGLITHVKMLTTSIESDLEGIVEMVISGQFAYISCTESTYCTSVVCQHLGYISGYSISNLFPSGAKYFSVMCSSASHNLNDCTLQSFTSYSASVIRCVEGMQVIDCSFGYKYEGTCLYTVTGSWTLNSYGYQLLTYDDNFESELKSRIFVTPASGSVYARINIMRPEVQMYFQFRTASSLYDLGFVVYGEINVCLDLPPSVHGYLVIKGKTTGPLLAGSSVVADLYEIKFNQTTETCPKAFPEGVCVFDRKCPFEIECSSRIMDPIPYQWVKGNSTARYLIADSSFGKRGDTAKFTLPINVTTYKILKFSYRNTGNISTNALQINLLFNGISTNMLKLENIATFGSWVSDCVSISKFASSEIIHGNIEFVGTRGALVSDDIHVSQVEVIDHECPHNISCNFQSSTICRYTKSSDSSFAWQWGTYYLASYHKQFIPTVDHTLGTSNGGYMYTTPCIGPENEGDVARLNTPQFNVLASTPMKASFYYHKNRLSIGMLKVYVNEHRSTMQSSLVFSMPSSHSDEWHYSCVNLPFSNVSVSLTFAAILGNGCDSVFALDDIVISSGECAEHLNEVTCNFENTNTCSYFTNYTTGSKYRWYRQKPETLSNNSGLLGDADGSSDGHYIYAESSNGEPGDKTYLSFLVFRSSHSSSLRFSYNMQGDGTGSIEVLSQNSATSTVTNLWAHTVDRNDYWIKECILLAQDTEQYIIFVATKSSEFTGYIALDNIYVVDRGCAATNVSCNFDEDDAFACGYINGTVSSPWIPVANQSDKEAPSTSSDTGTFLRSLVTSSDAGSRIISPEISVATASCLSFKYFVKLNSRKVEFYLLEGSNLTVVWSTQHATGNKWQSGQFDLYPKSDKIRISFVTHLSNELGIDDIRLESAPCTPLACPSQFSCGNFCIDLSHVCDRVLDCPDWSDEEKLCDGGITCNFEDSYLCGYHTNDHVSSNLFEGKHVIYQDWIHDHTYGNISGTFFGMVTFVGERFSFRSLPERLTNKSCLSLFYVGNVYLFRIEIKYSNQVMTNSINRNIYRTTDYHHIWKPAQVQLEIGKMQVSFSTYSYVHGFYNEVHYFGIDDIKLTAGDCHPLICPAGFSPCHMDGICVTGKVECDKYHQCPSGEDEADCPISISCDFEKYYACGYIFGSPFTFREAFRHHLPSIDHTYKNYSGHYMYFTSSTRQTSTFISPAGINTTGGCVNFYYNMEGGVSAEFKVYRYTRSSKDMVFYANGIFGKRDQWVEGWFEIPPGYIRIEFSAYGDVSNFAPSSVAIDDIEFREGQSCPQTVCEHSVNTFACERSGGCIPEFLTNDGYNDCLDGSDENNSSIPDISGVNQSSVRLVGGKTQASGRLEILVSRRYSPVCAGNWDVYDTKVVCKQLGYRTSRYFSKSEYGKGRPERPFLNYQYYCDGTENKLSECSSSTATCYSSDGAVAVQCTNSECFEGEISCGDGLNSTCISEFLWCNGNVDCPNSGDETDCATCRYNEYECTNHKCIPLINRCDGTPQCSDRSDEFRCVLRNKSNGQVTVYSNLVWTPLCYNNDTTLAHFLCSVIGRGPFSSFSRGGVITDGLSATPSANPYGVITNYILNHQMTCDALILQCGNIECGVPSVSPTSVGSYILYGNDAVPGEYPWQALLFLDGTVRCGATLIDPYYAITAAHCIEYMDSYRFQIHVGEVIESRMLTSNDHGQRISVAQAIMHPVYVGSFNSYLSDIAILRLSQPARYNEYVRPACIATEVRTSFDNCYATGWGYREDVQFGNVLADNLQEVKVDINYDIERCNKSIQKLGVIVPASGICVENQNPFTPACNGDSGGPLICQNQYGRWELVGVTSFGVKGCRYDQYPYIYQSVPYHIKWIRDMTGININAGNIPTPPP